MCVCVYVYMYIYIYIYIYTSIQKYRYFALHRWGSLTMAFTADDASSSIYTTLSFKIHPTTLYRMLHKQKIICKNIK